jgi:hypothetical protein
MKLDFFNDTKPLYIGVNIKGFNIDGNFYSKIECFIRDIIPVRKLFNGKKVECYSNDSKKGKNDEFCSICRKQNQCRQRMRLMLLIAEENAETPAMLEINTNSFASLREALEPIDEKELSKQLFCLKTEQKEKYLQIKFLPIF